MYIPCLLHSSGATVPHGPLDPRQNPLHRAAGSSPLTVHCSLPTFLHSLFSSFRKSLLPPARQHRFLFPSFSCTYKLPFSQVLCFDKHLRCPLVFLARIRDVQIFTPQNEPSPLYSYYCKLFVVAKKVIRIEISDFHALFQKHPGYGYPRTIPEEASVDCRGYPSGENRRVASAMGRPTQKMWMTTPITIILNEKGNFAAADSGTTTRFMKK
jgi:hypothetical protein